MSASAFIPYGLFDSLPGGRSVISGGSVGEPVRREAGSVSVPAWAVLAFLALCGMPNALSAAKPAEPALSDPRWLHAMDFLEARYGPAVGLLNETPYGKARTVYWINDNVFALPALGRGDGQAHALAASIQARLGEFAETLGLPRHTDGSVRLGLHDVMEGHPFDLPLPCRTNHFFTRDGATIAVSVWNPDYYVPESAYAAGYAVRNETNEPDCFVQEFDGWADLLLYDALAQSARGNASAARARLAAAYALWDGTGLADNAFVLPGDAQYQRYATYKVALLLHVASVVGEPLPDRHTMADVLWRMQAYHGGFITNYGARVTPNGQANTETTALALLALSDPAPIPAGHPGGLGTHAVLLAGLVVVGTAALLARRRAGVHPQSPRRRR